MCYNFPNLRTNIINTLKTMINTFNFWNAKARPVSKIILALLPYSEYLINLGGKGSKISIMNLGRAMQFLKI